MSQAQLNEAEVQPTRDGVDAAHFFESIEFALDLPSSFTGGSRNVHPIESHEQVSPLATGFEDYGIVGVVTILSQKSIMVWFGWGQVRSPASPAVDPSAARREASVGQCTFLSQFPVRRSAGADAVLEKTPCFNSLLQPRIVIWDHS
jgi:hypothetical protein